MPMHDWTRVDVGAFHDFHQGWVVDLSRSLNAGLLPKGYHAHIEYRPRDLYREYDPRESDATVYARRANRILIQTDNERAVALIMIVSPGNKDGPESIQLFSSQVGKYLKRGLNLLIVDPHSPMANGVRGFLPTIWDTVSGSKAETISFDKPLAVALFVAGVPPTAYFDPFDLGDPIPDMPLFLEPGRYVNVPLETSYLASWNVLPEITRNRVLSPPTA